jgi:hypothetical protein
MNLPNFSEIDKFKIVHFCNLASLELFSKEDFLRRLFDLLRSSKCPAESQEYHKRQKYECV